MSWEILAGTGLILLVMGVFGYRTDMGRQSATITAEAWKAHWRGPCPVCGRPRALCESYARHFDDLHKSVSGEVKQ